ncbi:hypothetical protein EJ06DRAFT_463027, partial [Trichodelitschia bisporula]
MISFNFGIPRLGLSRRSPYIDIPPVQTPDIETAVEKQPRTVKHLVKANHANNSIFYHNLQFCNHFPHLVASAYLFGADSRHLNDIYDHENKQLEPWADSPGEISREDWRDFLGKREYQRAFVDFFEDQLVLHSYDWKELIHAYLLDGKGPLINNMIGALGHPLIHLGYAFELSSPTLAIEALAMTSCAHNFLHKYLDDPSYTKPSILAASTPLDILGKIAQDPRFDLFSTPGSGNIAPLFEAQEAAVLEYWNAWDLSNAKEQFEKSQEAAVAMLVGTHESDSKYDFFLVHLLTTSHAVRIVLPCIPAQHQISVVKQWWLLAIAVYIAQLRPKIDLGRINGVDIKGRDWQSVDKAALTGKGALDAHYVKALRAMKEAAKTWGNERYYLSAALGFIDGFGGW